MCGIFGFQSHNQNKKNLFFQELKHRGPDSHAAISIDDWTLGHLRLAILDTSIGGDQPMQIEGNWIVFNGEIYNYLELKNKYLSDEKFIGSSDTEVLLKLLNKKGLKILHELNGMFAFAYYNVKTQVLSLCRDRFGVKPLYWTKINKKIYFASETKPLIKLLPKIELNPEIIETYMRETVSDHIEESFITGIFQVLPGHFLQIKTQEVKDQKWYQGNDYKFDNSIFQTKEKTLNYFEDLLTDAIEIRYRSDVPVCLTLSGGLDSSVIYTLTRKRLKKFIQPVIFHNKDSVIDELPTAQKLINRYGDTPIIVESRKAYTSEDLLDTFRVLEFPIWNPSAIAYKSTYQVIRKKGFKVVIEGHGSDEQLGGYPHLIEEIWRERIQQGKFFSGIVAYKALLSASNQAIEKRNKLLVPLQFLKVIIEKNRKKYSAKSLIKKNFERNILPVVLRAFDRLSMSEGLESRCPFMDFRLVEFINAMPSDFLVDELGSKAPLRHILKKYGNEFVYEGKPKIGFAIDIEQLLSQNEIKKFLITVLEKNKSKDYFKEIKFALKALHSQIVNWNDATKVWKICALLITKDMYER